ncbi:mechanosensitive ion channel family protein [Algoriphagus sp. NF]|uniref:mechanosensitive ion channel family protein n=1 Tax=Algoriphagus sp. NF TaxID=2992756 RepID=UPI00237B36A7|nr:mechanosensitive ion channel family protein [Algoriphagus sp. NF]MDE0559372.1 mechanosensitive ion channel family protein [Algoriphagus sp. NF]
MELEIEKPLNVVFEKVESWIDGFIAMIPNMIVAVLTFIIFLLLAKYGSKIAIKIFSKTSNNTALKNLLSTVVHWSILGLGVFIILGILGLEKAVTSLLAGVGVVGLALGFAFQDIAANFVSGIILAFRKPYRIGDVIEINDVMGKVLRTNLRVTVMETFQGQEVFIPNKELLQGNIVNYSSLTHRQIIIACGISYAEDLEEVESVVRKAILELEGLIRKDDLIFDYEEFGGSSINFYVRFWIEYPGEPGYLGMKSKAIKAIKKSFDQNNITIPFPIRTLDFGIKGGKTLSEMEIHQAVQDAGQN